MSEPGWKIADVHDIPPLKDSFTSGWHSVRHYFNIEGFGVNAVTKNAGDWLTKEHDESESGQQELFVVLEGEAEFSLDGKKVKAPAGSFISVEPHVKRGADAIVSPTTLLIIGAPVSAKYQPPGWDQL